MGVRIAVVDDEPATLSFCRKLLELDGFGVVLGHGGHDAVEIRFREPEPDLMLINWRMPDMNGDIAIAQIREREAREGQRRVPIVLETGDAIGARTTGVERHVDAILAKPFDIDGLRSAVERSLAQSSER